MVFSEKKQNKRRGASYHESAVTILTPGCHFSGKLYCKGSSRIGGRIEGEVVSEGLLVIEETALITAEIKAEEVIVQGRLKGRLNAKGRVEFAENSHFEGEVSTPSLVVMEGANFNGTATMTKPAKVSAESLPVVEKLRKKGSSGREEFGKKLPEVGVGKP